MGADDLVRMQKLELRYQVLAALETAFPERMTLTLLLRYLPGRVSARLEPSILLPELRYLSDGSRDLIETTGTAELVSRIKPRGLDVLDGLLFLPGIEIHEPPPDSEIFERRQLRWTILLTAQRGGIRAHSELFFGEVAATAGLRATSRDVRRALQYLDLCGLLTLNRGNPNCWLAAITADGTDVVDYLVDPPVGVGRPSDA